MRYLYSLVALVWAIPFSFASDPPAYRSVEPPAAVVVGDSTNPADACVAVWCDYAGGSGTCVAVADGKSLILTNNHIFAQEYDADGGFARAPYPVQGKVIHKGKTYKAVAVSGVKSSEGDLAVMVVDGVLPKAELAGRIAAPGTPIWHMGIGSGGERGVVSRGTVLPNPRGISWPSDRFTSNVSSISGDSGAAIFDNRGQVVGINCGRHSPRNGETQRGTAIDTIRTFLSNLKNWRGTKFADPPAAVVVTPKSKKADPYGVADYDDFYAKVGRVGRGILVVGVPDQYVGTYNTHCRVESGFRGLADGEYDCWVENGSQVIKIRPVPNVMPAASGVIVQPPTPAANPATNLLDQPPAGYRYQYSGGRLYLVPCNSPFG